MLEGPRQLLELRIEQGQGQERRSQLRWEQGLGSGLKLDVNQEQGLGQQRRQRRLEQLQSAAKTLRSADA